MWKKCNFKQTAAVFGSLLREPLLSEWMIQRKQKETQIQLIFYHMKVSQGRSERRVNTIPECRFISLFYKSQRAKSLSDHYYHTNRQIYLTTLFLSHNTYSLVLHSERRWNVSLSHSPLASSRFFLLLFFILQRNRLWVDKGSEQ